MIMVNHIEYVAMNITLFLSNEALAKLFVIPEFLYRGYGFSSA